MAFYDLLFKLPFWADYLLFLGAVSADAALENATGGTFSITKTLSTAINALIGFFAPGFSIPIDATGLLFFSVCLGVMMGVLWIASARK